VNPEINSSKIPVHIRNIIDKVAAGTRITSEEGLILFEEANPGILAFLANSVRENKNGKQTFFVRNYHIEPTNRCVYDCKFCSYREKITGKGWDLSMAEILETVKKLDKQIKELHIVGGVHPSKDLEFYATLFAKIREINPGIHIKALSAIELDYLFRLAKVDISVGLRILKDNGLQSIPGGGAEIFDKDIRKKICPSKADAERWLEIHREAHLAGIPTNATILYGHIESYRHRIEHLEKLRSLQDDTGGFNAFIPLKFKNANNEMSDIREVNSLEDMKNYAISRIFLDNFSHIKTYWPMLGKDMAQLALAFGVDDIDGTIEDSTKIYTLAGSSEQNPSMTVMEMTDLIEKAGFIPVERDALYNPVVNYLS